ncbi:Nuclear pore complex protein NUP107 [Camellia lanceoleosa]|uniref:Nuclear pore complex protein NUP107 n=1 Tax=Camellia lanceoleosa TaxID=1840588 RepID=A0ACC0INV3_9ERIC|nr:Nuclear pore complex protein NUP107 [Camellia lanceoleosa]
MLARLSVLSLKRCMVVSFEMRSLGFFISLAYGYCTVNSFITVLFVHLLVHVKYKIFVSAIEYLPFSPGDDSKGSFEEIVERVLSRSREIKPGKYDKSSDIAEQHRLQSLQKAMVIQWLCFTPPSTINDAQASSAKLLLRALLHSNILFRELLLFPCGGCLQCP